MRAWFIHELRVVPREYILPSLCIVYRDGFFHVLPYNVNKALCIGPGIYRKEMVINYERF